MLKLSRKTLYALEAVADIAYNARAEPVQSKEITARQGIPQRYLEQVMQQLVRAGILKGVRGPRGGYLLARERRRVSVGEIVRVIAAMEDEAGGGYESESAMGKRIIAPLLDSIQQDMMERLDSVTVEDLCSEAAGTGVPRESKDRLDFTI
ncbi:Rrf2 family transcriptional regulator [Emcibacter sp. SYSU 3D8]|uniref:RrF2 family transcriptional regulator n=1 Tax=Emcibacter sp. SYSU 3D8 TaxID=3133969 RepID=UPI0031FE793D